MRTNERTYRHNEAYSRLSQFYERAKKFMMDMNFIQTGAAGGHGDPFQ
jgi:hypothetical protein